MRAAIAAESVGIPSVSIVCEGFEGQASATARGHGHDGLALAVTVGHVDAQSAEERVRNFVDVTVDQVIDGLVAASDPDRSDGDGTIGLADADEPAALDIVVSGSLDEIQAEFVRRGWTDGHPVVPPTRDRVEAFLDDTGRDPWRSLGVAASSGRDVTIWSLAVNAVMAGCRREHLPVLLAIAEALVDPGYGVEHSGNTTGADALVVASGPGLAELGLTAGPGAQREGVHANTAIGRWVRLVLRNVFGFTADQHDKATFGNPARPVLVEHHDVLDEIGWPSLADEVVTENAGASGGGPMSSDALCIARMNSGTIIGSVVGATPDEMVPYLADGLVRTASWDLTHVYGLGRDQFSPLLVLAPVLARALARAGWGKDDLRSALFRNARITAAAFERYVGTWSNLTAGRPRLLDLARDGLVPEVYGESDDPDRLVPIVCRPDRIRVAVAGDPHRTNAYAFSNDGPHGWWTGRPIDHSPGSDLVCSIDGACAVPAIGAE